MNYLGQNFQGLEAVHLQRWIGFRGRVRSAISKARVREYLGSRYCGKLQREVLPHRHRSETFMEQDDGCALGRTTGRRKPLILDLSALYGEKAAVAQCLDAHSRNLKRWILPVGVFGSSVTNSIQRGYL